MDENVALVPRKTRKARKTAETRRTDLLLYTVGELNKGIDAVVHPLTKAHPELWILDGALHALVEGNLELSIRKFIRYDLPKILEQLTKRRK